MADLVNVDPKGNEQWISSDHLKAAHRALVSEKSKPYYPVQDPVPVPPGKAIEYAIAMMPTSNVFKIGGPHVELVIRNQDDLLSRLGTWGGIHMSLHVDCYTCHSLWQIAPTHSRNSHLRNPEGMAHLFTQ